MIKTDEDISLIQGGVPFRWDDQRWPHFSRAELSCRHCGEYAHDTRFLDALEMLRAYVKAPIHILSAHRCSLHNARVGGAPFSQHLGMAVDIALYNHDRHHINSAAKSSGFSGFGYYTTFLHLDMGRPRFWFGSKKAKNTWQTYLA